MNVSKVILDNPNTYLPELAGESFYIKSNSLDPVCQWIGNNKLLYEHHLIYLLKPLLLSSSIFIDIGCNVGTYSYYYTTFGPKSGKAICLDASIESLDLLCINCKTASDRLTALHGFWSPNSDFSNIYKAETLPIKKYFKDVNSLQSAQDNQILCIPNSSLIERISSHLASLSSLASQKNQNFFVKIDVDGNERRSAAELFSDLIQLRAPFYALVEVNHTSTYHEICESGMLPKALLVGDNILFASPHCVECVNATTTYSNIAGFSNRWLTVSQEKLPAGTSVEKVTIPYMTPFGLCVSHCQLLNSKWKDTLLGQNIFAIVA